MDATKHSCNRLEKATGCIVAPSSNQISCRVSVWWPQGYGEQPLYRVVPSLHSHSKELDRQEKRLGIRRLELVQQPVTHGSGTTFFFSVNNTPIYCGGVNWIPADSFLPSIPPERYRAWLQLAVDAHVTMVHVWGGGIYEDWLSANDGVQWSDNMLDLFPNEPHIIKASGLDNGEIQVRWLGQ